MHNLFEAKGRTATTRGPQGREWGMGFWEGAVSPYPPAECVVVCGSVVACKLPVWGPANAFRCILSSKIASGGNFFDYLFQLKKWKWCTLMHFEMPILMVCLIIENHRKYPTLEWTGIEPLEAGKIFKNMSLKHQTGQSFKKHCGKSQTRLCRRPAGHMLCNPDVDAVVRRRTWSMLIKRYCMDRNW